MSVRATRARAWMQSAIEALDAEIEDERSEYERGYEAGVASVSGNQPRTMTGEQFFARLMNSVSPDSPGWAELHRLGATGFGRAITVTGVGE